MSRPTRGILQALFLVLFAFLLIRLFPVVMRLSAQAASNIVSFWWVVLIVAMGAWLIWVFRKRNSG